MNKIKNWLLAALFFIGAVADLGFDFLNEVVAELGLSPKIVVVIRLIVVLAGVIKLKLEAPSTNPDKLQDLVYKAEENKKE